MTMQSRRNLLKFLALGTAVAAVGTSTKAQATKPGMTPTAPEPSLPASGPAPWWLIDPLREGSTVGKGWTVVSLSRVEYGAAVLTLTKGTDTARIHLCLHEGTPKGLSHTAMFDLILMDGGNGDRRTPESLARVIRDLSARIRANEVRAEGDWNQMAKLMTHGERQVAFGPENLT